MKNFTLCLFGLLFVSIPTFAGGLLTYTNQNVAFLRNPAREGAIDIDGVYSNPAGVAFMPKGWHLSLNIQSAYQQRNITSQFAPFALGEGNNGSTVKKFKGNASAPVAPSVQLAYVGDKWTFQGSFAITGGGGKCTFDDGLGSFESQVAMLPSVINTVVGKDMIDGYSADMYMKGRQYYYGMQMGIGYKVTPHLSVNVGGRLLLASCNYYGYVRDISIRVKGTNQYVNAAQALTAMGYGQYASLVGDKAVDCDQSGWSFMTVIGADYKFNDKLNVSAKYEFNGLMHLKNQSNNTSGVSEFDDGRHVRADVPALLGVGIQYSFLPRWRGSVAYHHFFDKHAKQYENRQKYLKEGTNEYLFGLEYDLNKRVTLSAGYQSTNYGFGKNNAYLSDMSFTTSSNSVGLGVEVHLSKKVRMNIAYFKSFYNTYTKTKADYAGTAALGFTSPQGVDKFKRTNDVFGVNLNLDL